MTCPIVVIAIAVAWIFCAALVLCFIASAGRAGRYMDSRGER